MREMAGREIETRTASSLENILGILSEEEAEGLRKEIERLREKVHEEFEERSKRLWAK